MDLRLQALAGVPDIDLHALNRQAAACRERIAQEGLGLPVRHHGGVPAIDPHKYELLIHGMVDKPMVFTLADLKRFPSVSRICFLECSGNFRGSRETLTPQEICGLTSQSEWTGVMLSTL